MRFWDASAIVALVVAEADSSRRAAHLRDDPAMAVWWSTVVECESALQRRVRDSSLDAAGARQARERLADLSSAWHEVPPSPGLRSLALRLLRTHPLRAADALQLAAALTFASGLRQQVVFACSDERLSDAAEIEGLVALR
jgi:uncharacterized protein